MQKEICSIDGCDNDGKLVRGWCDKHYTRFKRHGDPNTRILSENKGKICSIKGCRSSAKSLGFCNKHYIRLKNHGDPEKILTNENGKGCINCLGYRMVYVNDKQVLEHRHVMSQRIGRGLASIEVVHHKDRNRSNNDINNLFLLPNKSAHRKLHADEDAKEACGHKDWRRCLYCKEYDDPENMRRYSALAAFHHRSCYNKHRRNEAAERRAAS